MKKRFLLLLATIVFSMSSLFTTFANSEQLNELNVNSAIFIDGKAIDTTDSTIYTDENSITMYPLRLIAENLGAKVSWDNSKKCVSIFLLNDEVLLTPNNKKVSVNGVDKNLKYTIENKNSRIYVPAEFLIEILDTRIKLDSNLKNINIQKSSKSLENPNLSAVEQIIQNNIASYLTSLELNRNFSGQVLVAQNGKVLIDRSYGYSDYENYVKTFNNTTFAIGSITKQFTAAAIAQLVEKNKLSYDDKVSKYLTDVPFGDKITIHHLLTHTSGLFNFTNTSDLKNINTSEMNYTKLISLIKDKPLDFEPGTNWNYSNTGYLILGRIVEKVSEKTLEEYLKENIFEPVGMNNTNIAYNLDKKIVEAKGYTGHMDIVPDNLDALLLNIAYGAGFLCSTTEDLYKWDLALQEGKVVSTDSLSKIFGKYPETNNQYGYGWFFTNETYGEEISHGGNTCGFTGENAMFTEKNAHIIILSNKGYVNLSGIKKNISNILSGNKVTPLKERGKYDILDTELSKYTGKFIAEGIEVNIVNNSGILVLTFQGIPCKLVAESKEKLYSRDFDIELEYTYDDNKDVTGIILNAFGLINNYKKTEDKNYITIPQDQIEKYIGIYEIKGILKFSVSVKDGKLIVQGEGQPEFEVIPYSETEFESLMYGVKIKFDSKDAPKGFTIYQAGQQFDAIKIK